MTKTNYAENKVLDWFAGRSLTTIVPYVALFRTAPTDISTGTEQSGGGYARVATTPAHWATPLDGSMSNILPIVFPVATAAYAAPITHWGIFDALTSGNLLRWAILETTKTVALDETPMFAIGQLALTEN